MKKILTFVAIALVVALGAGCEPNGATKTSGGQIKVTKNSASAVSAFTSWSADGPKGKSTKLGPGYEWTGAVDVDGFCAPKGFKIRAEVHVFGFKGPSQTVTLKSKQCFKINDLQSAVVTVLR